MKCQKCGIEYNEKQYIMCPRCFFKPSTKERLSEKIWNITFSLLVFAIILLTAYGCSHLFGKASAIIFIVLGIIYSMSLTKRNENQKQRIVVKVKKLLEDPEYDCVSDFKKQEIIKAIKDEKH